MLNNTNGSPSPYRLHDSSFAIEGDLNQESQGGTQMSGQIIFNTPSNVLPNILPALGPGA